MGADSTGHPADEPAGEALGTAVEPVEGGDKPGRADARLAVGTDRDGVVGLGDSVDVAGQLPERDVHAAGDVLALDRAGVSDVDHQRLRRHHRGF